MCEVFTFFGPDRDWTCPLLVIIGGGGGSVGGGGTFTLGRAGDVAALQVPGDAPEDMRAGPRVGKVSAQVGQVPDWPYLRMLSRQLIC